MRHTLDAWFKVLVVKAINPVFGFLARTLLSTPRLDRQSRVRSLWTGSLVVANTCFVLLVVIAGLTLMGHPTLQGSYTVKDVAPRLVTGMVLANLSLLLIGKAIGFANALSRALAGRGVSVNGAAKTLTGVVMHAIAPGDVSTFLLFIGLGAVVLGFILALVYVVRVMLTILLIALAPLALACHALPQTEGLARFWWRALAGVLAIQVLQSLVFITAMRVVWSSNQATVFGIHGRSGTLDMAITICLLYILLRIPFWVSRMVWRGALGRSPISGAARFAFGALVLRRVSRVMAGSRSSRGPMPPPRRPPSPAPRGPLPSPVRPGGAPRWQQPALPLDLLERTARPVRQEALPLPGLPEPSAPRAKWVQLRLPGASSDPPWWRQPALPMSIHAEQAPLPLTVPPRHTQQRLSMAVPERGTPEAGRSVHRAAEVEALRRAEQASAQRHARTAAPAAPSRSAPGGQLSGTPTPVPVGPPTVAPARAGAESRSHDQGSPRAGVGAPPTGARSPRTGQTMSPADRAAGAQSRRRTRAVLPAQGGSPPGGVEAPGPAPPASALRRPTPAPSRRRRRGSSDPGDQERQR